MELKNTKEQILDAALRLFSENSYHGASIRDIAKAVGKRESSIYNHFKSKDEILEKIIEKFSERNFGPIILTDVLINNISKPEKFFLLLSENLLEFWSSTEEQMFIKILLSKHSAGTEVHEYSLDSYVKEFRKLCKFIFKEMIKHKFINKYDTDLLSREFISSLLVIQIELIHNIKKEKEKKNLLKQHVDFFWKAVKR